MAYRISKEKAPLFPRKPEDSPYPIPKFNQHVILSRLFPECQPKGGFPVDINILMDSDLTDSDLTSEDNDDGTTSSSSNEILPTNHSTTNDVSNGLTSDNNLSSLDTTNDDDDDGTTGLPTGEILPNNPSTRNDASNGLTSDNNTSSSEVGGKWIVGNSEGSIELEYGVRCSSIRSFSWLASSPPPLPGQTHLSGGSTLRGEWDAQEIVIPDSEDKRNRGRVLDNHVSGDEDEDELQGSVDSQLRDHYETSENARASSFLTMLRRVGRELYEQEIYGQVSIKHQSTS